MLPSKRILVALLFLSLCSACSKVDDMHDATMEMNNRTSNLADTSNEMHDVMSEIYDSGRQGAALDLRTKMFGLVTDSTKLEDKATYAGLYFVAFEFQLWSRVGLDNHKGERELLMRDAAEEFFHRLTGLTHWDGVDPFAGTNPVSFSSADNERASFNALAVALEKNNRKQESLVAGTDEQAVSMLQMIETALRAEEKIRAGEARLSDYPEYVDMILQKEELATRLLESRYQMLGLAVLCDLTPIGKNMVEGFKYKIWGKRWQLDLSKLNESELRISAKRLRMASEARALLAELGIQVELDSSIRSIYSHASLVNGPGSPAAENLSADKAEAQAEFLAAAQDYLGEAIRH